MDDADNGQITTQGKVIDEITEDQREYYGLDEADFPEPSGGRSRHGVVVDAVAMTGIDGSRRSSSCCAEWTGARDRPEPGLT